MFQKIFKDLFTEWLTNENISTITIDQEIKLQFNADVNDSINWSFEAPQDIDFKIGKKNNLVALAPLDEAANFIENFNWLMGKNATDPKTIDLILENLKNKNILFYTEMYPHVYPHCWRSGDELVFRLVDEWYINMDWRNDIKKSVDHTNWVPSWGQQREHEWLNNMGDWMISKKRFWGLALPICLLYTSPSPRDATLSRMPSYG